MLTVFYLESIAYNSFVARGVRNVCEAELMRKRSEHAQERFGEAFQRHFSTDCQMKSLISRLNRCSRDYFTALFKDVENMTTIGHPEVRFVLKPDDVRFSPGFNGKYGGRDTVDIFQSFRDSYQSRYPSIVIPDAETKIDSLRMVLGTEFRCVI